MQETIHSPTYVESYLAELGQAHGVSVRLYNDETDWPLLPCTFEEQPDAMKMIHYIGGVTLDRQEHKGQDGWIEPVQLQREHEAITAGLDQRTAIVEAVVCYLLQDVSLGGSALRIIPARSKSAESTEKKVGRRLEEKNYDPLSDTSAIAAVIVPSGDRAASEATRALQAYGVLERLRDQLHTPVVDRNGKKTITHIGNGSSTDGVDGLQGKFWLVIDDALKPFEVQLLTEEQYNKEQKSRPAYEERRAESSVNTFRDWYIGTYAVRKLVTAS